MEKMQSFKKSFALIFTIGLVIFLFLSANTYNNAKITLDSDTQVVSEISALEYRFESVYLDKSVIKAEKAFDLKWEEYLKKFDLLSIDYKEDAKSILYSDPVFVSGFSDNHFHEAITMLRMLKEVYPDQKKIVVYNLGITNADRKKLDQFDNLIIKVVDFPFNLYPKYVANLNEYRWKPLIIAEMLTKYQSIWWIDSSTQISGKPESLYKEMQNCSDKIAEDGNPSKCNYYPWITIDNGGHSIFATTEPNMFRYLPIPEEPKKNLTMIGANIQLIFRLKHLKEKVLKFWVLCALQEDCMAPKGSQLYCKWASSRYTEYAHCHRFDQSALTILLAWANNFSDARYRHNGDGKLIVVRM